MDNAKSQNLKRIGHVMMWDTRAAICCQTEEFNTFI